MSLAATNYVRYSGDIYLFQAPPTEFFFVKICWNKHVGYLNCEGIAGNWFAWHTTPKLDVEITWFDVATMLHHYRGPYSKLYILDYFFRLVHSITLCHPLFWPIFLAYPSCPLHHSARTLCDRGTSFFIVFIL